MFSLHTNLGRKRENILCHSLLYHFKKGKQFIPGSITGSSKSVKCCMPQPKGQGLWFIHPQDNTHHVIPFLWNKYIKTFQKTLFMYNHQRCRFLSKSK